MNADDTAPIPPPAWDPDPKLYDACIAVALEPISIAVQSLIHGWSLMLMWAWFISPATGLDPIGYWLAVGLCLVLTVVQLRWAWNKPEFEAEGYTKSLLGRLVFHVVNVSAFTFGGWVVQAWFL